MMTEQEFHGWMVIGGLMMAVSLLAWFVDRSAEDLQRILEKLNQ